MAKILNVEIKAICKYPEKVKEMLALKQADSKGTDHQIDTYFNCPNGRLKLREGNIEHSLIFYNRNNEAGPKVSDVELIRNPAEGTKTLLTRAFGVKVIVDKKRAIYFIDNVKFHVDTVQGLGTFVEIEAIDETGDLGKEKLYEQCQHYLELLQIDKGDLLEHSYSDMLLENKIS